MHGHEMFIVAFLGNNYTGIAYETHTFVITIDEEILTLPFFVKDYAHIFSIYFYSSCIEKPLYFPPANVLKIEKVC